MVITNKHIYYIGLYSTMYYSATDNACKSVVEDPDQYFFSNDATFLP